MKKILYPIVFLLITFSDTYAQNWECMKTDDEYYYGKLQISQPPQNDTSMVLYETIAIDSVYSESDNTVYRNHQSIKESENYSCYITTGPSFLGNKAFSDNAGFFHFISNSNDTLHIKSNAQQGENWVFYLNSSSNLKIIAYIDTIVYDASIFLPDSVKIIKFFAQNFQGDSIQHSINNKSLRIGKNHGFISIFDFRIFPGNINKYNLVGTKNSIKGYKNFGAAEIWDMEIGDEFHFLRYVSSSSCPSATYYIRKVINKQEIDNILHLNFVEWSFHTAGVLCSGTDTMNQRFYSEVIDFEDPLVKRWNSLPGESYAAGNYAGYFNLLSSSDSLLQEKRHSSPPLIRYDSTSECFQMDIDPFDWNGYDYAIKGAGGYYFRGIYVQGYTITLDFTLNYFKKGNKKYGIPFDYGRVMGWWPFNYSRSFYWGRNQDNTFIAEEQIQFNGPTQSHISASYNTIGLSDETCWTDNKIGIFGKDILTDNRGTYRLINNNDDTIVFKAYTSLNQEWLFYKNDANNLVIKAKCKTEESGYPFWKFDSIRSYSFQAYDLNGTPIDHPVNSKEIRMSKNVGFLSTFDFYYFPDSLDLQNYTLNGYYEWQAEQGKINRNLTLPEVYGMKVGDRIDLVNTTTFEGGQTVTETIKYVIGRTGSTTSLLTLDFRVLSKIITYYDQGDSTVQYLQDTITQIIDFTNDFTAQFNKEVGNIMEVDGGYKIAHLEKSNQLYNGRLLKEINPVIFTNNDP
ncbi:MAG TPA: hypothetical protein VK172_09665, partial [Lentimicrobium sp.]|nr:hypothetical protein [Lentimicrobium sp.]